MEVLNNKRFPISTCVCCINDLVERYRMNDLIVPSFQRDYSWDESNVNILLENILENYNKKQYLFVGTIQISKTKKDNKTDEFLIIDGQQRLTTLTLLLKSCNIINKNLKYINILHLNINNNDQYRNYYENLFKSKSPADEIVLNDNNKYLINYKLINSFILSLIDENNNKFNINDFIKYIENNIYFVLLETDEKLGISQVVNIFNSINTTGLDLNCSDLFKLQFADFLRGDIQSDLTRISSIYSEVTKCNNLLNNYSWSIDDILLIYQHLITTKLELGVEHFIESKDSFYDYIFKNINKNNDLFSLDSLEYLVRLFNRVRTLLKNQKSEFSLNEYFAEHFIENSRYSRMWTFPYIFLYRESLISP